MPAGGITTHPMETMTDEQLTAVRESVKRGGSKMLPDERRVMDGLLAEALRARTEARKWQTLLAAIVLRSQGAVACEGPLLDYAQAAMQGKGGEFRMTTEEHAGGHVIVRCGVYAVGVPDSGFKPSGVMTTGEGDTAELAGWAPCLTERCSHCGKPGQVFRSEAEPSRLRCQGCGGEWELPGFGHRAAQEALARQQVEVTEGRPFPSVAKRR